MNIWERCGWCRTAFCYKSGKTQLFWVGPHNACFAFIQIPRVTHTLRTFWKRNKQKRRPRAWILFVLSPSRLLSVPPSTVCVFHSSYIKTQAQHPEPWVQGLHGIGVNMCWTNGLLGIAIPLTEFHSWKNNWKDICKYWSLVQVQLGRRMWLKQKYYLGKVVGGGIMEKYGL